MAGAFNQVEARLAAVLVIGLLLCRTQQFFPSSGSDHHQYSLYLPMEGCHLVAGSICNIYKKHNITYPFINPLSECSEDND